MNGCSGASSICPCGTVVHPAVIFNPAALNTIAYRVGQYADFRYALLQALPTETELSQIVDGRLVANWQPTAEGDLALQMMEWFAYLADILTFYNERIATQTYLLTADLPESPGRLIALLGYRPRPALGARGTLAALVTGAGPFTLPAHLAIQSKPGPGHTPQTFELDADTIVLGPDGVTAAAQPSKLPPFGAPASGTPASGAAVGSAQTAILWLDGKVSGLKVNDKLLLVDSAYVSTAQSAQLTDFAWIVVVSVDPATSADGKPVTQITFTLTPAGSTMPNPPNSVKQYALLRSPQSSPPWSFPKPATGVITPTTIDLAAIARSISIGDLILLDGSAAVPPSCDLVQVTNYAELVWYANGDGLTPPPDSPPGSVVAVSVPHTELTFAPNLQSVPAPAQIVARYAFMPVGTLVAVNAKADLAYTGGTAPLSTSTPPNYVPTQPSLSGGSGPVLLRDSSGVGAAADATFGSGQLTLTNVEPPPPPSGLAAPIEVFLNRLPVSRGKTVTNEVLGSGDGRVLGQTFTLQQSPVTYFADAASKSGDGFSSSVRVWVNSVEWTEARSFYGTSKSAPIFVLHEDEQGNTHVLFGDSINGARLPTGVDNVVATYRYGAGAAAPAPGTLTAVLQPQPGLKSIVNPLAPTGGADADSAARIKQLAPASVLTFGRAVSLDDYRVIAAGAPGVTQAQAQFVYDFKRQRPCVTIWVAGDDGAVAAARSALQGAADPNAPLVVNAATPVAMTLAFTYVRNPQHQDADVKTRLMAALIDPDAGLFGANVVGIGQSFYASEIYAACLTVPGVDAIRSLSFTPTAALRFLRFRLRPPLSRAPRPRFGLAPALTVPLCTGERYDPGSGMYFVVSLGTLSATAAA